MTQERLARALLAVAVATTGCAPLVLRAEYRPVGLAAPRAIERSVASSDKVLLFHQNAPDGFTLRENELKVEPGYAHRILGTVEVRYAKGYCHVVDNYAPNADLAVQRLVKKRAFRSGANAIIYFESELRWDAPKRDLIELCKSRNYVGSASYASGWLVVLAAKPAAPASTAPVRIKAQENPEPEREPAPEPTPPAESAP